MQSVRPSTRGIWLAPILIATAIMLIFGSSSASRAATAQAATSQPATTCSGELFTDVCPADWFYSYVVQLADLGAISGYSDGTFRPGSTITRGQMVKVVALATGLTAPMPGSPTFADVPTTNPFYTWVEISAANSVVNGYSCGGSSEPCPGLYFRPGANVSRGQLSKILVSAVGWLPLVPGAPTYGDVSPTNPFYGYVERASANGIVGGYDCGGVGEPCPGRYFRPGGTSTRAQACKMISLARARRYTPTPTATGTLPTSTPTFTRTATRTPTNTFTPAPTNTPGGPCAIFPANNIWNRNIEIGRAHV